MKFRKKPVVVEAVKYCGGVDNNIDFILHLFPDINLHISSISSVGSNPPDWAKKPDELYVETIEGWMKVKDGDWIIKGVKGEFYPCKPDIFEQTYEKVEETSDV
jgi:hypothetical protein